MSPGESGVVSPVAQPKKSGSTYYSKHTFRHVCGVGQGTRKTLYMQCFRVFSTILEKPELLAINSRIPLDKRDEVVSIQQQPVAPGQFG